MINEQVNDHKVGSFDYRNVDEEIVGKCQAKEKLTDLFVKRIEGKVCRGNEKSTTDSPAIKSEDAESEEHSDLYINRLELRIYKKTSLRVTLERHRILFLENKKTDRRMNEKMFFFRYKMLIISVHQ